MNFVAELKFDLSTDIDDETLKLHFINKANKIYSILNRFPKSSLDEINIITFLSDGINNYESLLKSSFSEYSSDISDYKDIKINEIWDSFPHIDERAIFKEEGHILNLIRRPNFIFVKRSDQNSKEGESIANQIKRSGKNICVFLPLCGNKLNSIIDEFELEIISFFTDGYASKSINEKKIFQIDTSVYVETKSKLNRLKEKYSFIKNAKLALLYRHPTFLDNFKGTKYYEILEALVLGDIKRIFILGRNGFLLDRSIRHLMPNEFPIIYDLIYGKPLIRPDRNVLIRNLNLIQNKKFIAELFEILNKVDSDLFIFLQSINRFLDTYYMDTYKDLELPSEEDTDKLTTSLFISLLYEHRKLEKKICQIPQFIKENFLSEVLSEKVDLTALNKTIQLFNKITEEDLIENINFWVALKSEYNKIIKRQTENKNYIIEKTLVFKRKGKFWEIIGFPVELKNLPKLKVVYLLIIMTKGKIKVLDLRKAVINYNKGKDREKKIKELNEVEDTKNAADACRNRINELKAANEYLKEFIKTHIGDPIRKTYYWNPEIKRDDGIIESISFEVQDKDFNEEIFKID